MFLMIRKEVANFIIKIINSEKFKESIIKINKNFSNLKQEGFIRNSILYELNASLDDKHLKAFAEHPREKGTKIDLSVVDLNNIENPIKIEFKFQFSGDANNMVNYRAVIEKDFEVRNSDLFILILSHWNVFEKREYDKKWEINTNLSRYISKNENWRKNILEEFKNFKQATLMEIEKIQINEPYKTDYYFYILCRN